ncbi:PH domain-containing protein [Clostridium sp. CTA-7]
MLKKLASDALGLSDIGKIIDKKDFNRVDADDYIMHEDGEQIFFLIKSRTDEYCFTNLALIHVDGTSAVSKKRLVTRYDYYKNPISRVSIETAGTIDLDCEIKFIIGEITFSIDVDRNQVEQLKDLYKSLVKIGHIIEENQIMLEKSEETLNIAANAFASSKVVEGDAAVIFKNINEYAFNWTRISRETYVRKDFTDVFKNYINN